jgi:hypothetical protein
MSLQFVSFADPITFVYQGTASGSIGGTNFSSAAFTITAFGDTANRQSLGSRLVIVHDSGSISITGVGTFTFATPLVTFVETKSGFAGLGLGDIYYMDLSKLPLSGDSSAP